MPAYDIVDVLREAASDIEAERAKFEALMGAAKDVLAWLDDLKLLYGQGSLASTLADRLRRAIEGMEG